MVFEKVNLKLCVLNLNIYLVNLENTLGSLCVCLHTGVTSVLTVRIPLTFSDLSP